MVRLVIFDHSGVLVNDVRESWQCISKIVGLHGHKPDDLPAFCRNFKMPYWEYLMEKGFSELDAKSEGVVNDYVRYYMEMIDHVKLFEEVEYTLTALVEKNTELAMVSHSPRRVIRKVEDKFKLSRFFKSNSVFGMGDYRRQKPHPESIEMALTRLAYAPSDAIYVGDMREDIEAARRAHVRSVAIYRENGSYHIQRYLRDESPTFFITDLKEILAIVENDL